VLEKRHFFLCGVVCEIVSGRTPFGHVCTGHVGSSVVMVCGRAIVRPRGRTEFGRTESARTNGQRSGSAWTIRSLGTWRSKVVQTFGHDGLADCNSQRSASH
jgi:hypothetical protein